MLKKIRIVLAALFFICITLLFLDFTGTLHHWLGWMAKIQFLPALMALNGVVLLILVALTLLFGRIYCSVICPLGVMQDIFAWFGTRKKKNKYCHKRPQNSIRYAALGIFIVFMAIPVTSVALLIAPYSAYGRIAQNLFAPVYAFGNNILAYFAERADSYAFYATEIWIKSVSSFIIALLTFGLVGFLAWRGGRTWCNTVCPVGTILGFLSRFAWFKPTIDTSKCIQCRACEKRCKSACIDIDTHTIDASRCVVCMNCIENCKKGAIAWKHMPRVKPSNQTASDVPSPKEASTSDGGTTASETPAEKTTPDAEKISAPRRGFLLALPTLAMASVAQADDKTTDGGMAPLVPRETPRRETPVKPAGALSLRNFSTRCTACQLCVAECPNDVLRPSASLKTLMQPEMHFERGFCRPECTRCSEICPAGAIQPISRNDKAATQVGIAVWTLDLCLPATGKDKCGNCARHCPNGAITMVEHTREDETKFETPAIDTTRCLGCGACEFVCPVRPISAIHVEGVEVHREV